MVRRREFLKIAGAAAATTLVARNRLAAQTAADHENALHFVSGSMELQLSSVAPEFLSLNVDGLGKSRRGANIVDPKGSGAGFEVSSAVSDGKRRVEYRDASADTGAPAAWTVECAGNRIVLASQWYEGTESVPFVFHFNLNQVHSTVLGIFRKDKLMAAPALLHFPGQGSMRLTADTGDIGLTFQSARFKNTTFLSLPGATSERKHIVYTLEVTAVYPDLPGIAGDARFDAFRRNWLNALQISPEYPSLANNSASDTCAFCYFEYADIAALTPPLAKGLTALDLMRQTLDRMLAGAYTYGYYGVPGYYGDTEHPTISLDTYPSMIIAAANCVRAGGNDAWLAANYGGIRKWAENMLATDTDGNGLLEYSISGNSGIWHSGKPTVRPANWWDTIGFGHEDAYSNALAYRALRNMAEMAKEANKPDDAVRYQAAADKLRGAYFQRFYNPETGVLAGWRSADGQLHDYYFLWVNGIAIHYGLVPKPQANAIMDKLMAKMKKVGYDKFSMGLPGNLVTIALQDCVDNRGKGRYGCGANPDNSDGFQNYENGGATGCFAFFTLAALYDLGRKTEADAILFPMLEAYGNGGFEGRDTTGFSPDWRRWDGTNKGYEGYLTDDYHPMLAVPLRQSEVAWKSGFRPATALA